MPSKKTLMISALVAGILVIVIWSLRPQAVPADIIQAERATLTVSVREQARTRVKDRFDISAPITGFAPRLDWEAGDCISTGQVLVELYPTPSSVLDPRGRESAQAEVARAQAGVAAAEAALEAAQAAAEFADSEYLRLEPLFRKGTISASQLDRARAERNRANAELRSAQSNVEVARQTLRYARAALVQGSTAGDEAQTFPLQSPVDGCILEVLHKSAGVVQPGQALLVVGDRRSLEVVAEVLTADAVRLRPGMAVELERWGGDDALLGEVRRIEPGAFTKISALGVEEQRTNVIIDITSPPEQWRMLGHGYRVEARFIVWREDGALSVPNGAVFRHQNSPAVFTVVDGRARLTPVETGRRGELRTMISSGLEAGQAIIAHPDREISDGTRVKPFR